MSYDLSGFEFISLDRLTEQDQRLPFDPRVMDSLVSKDLVRGSVDAWTLTCHGRALVTQVMGTER